MFTQEIKKRQKSSLNISNNIIKVQVLISQSALDYIMYS